MPSDKEKQEMETTRRSMLIAGSLAPVLSGLATQAFGTETEKAVLGPRALYFPNVALHTQDNKKVRFYDDLIRGKVVIVNFFFTRCENLCPRQIANLASVQKLLGDRVGREVFMYSITLDPQHDRPKDLKHFAAMHGAGPGWLFLTGKPEDIELLRHKLGFVDPDPQRDADRSEHIGMVLYGNEMLDRWAACPCLAPPEWMATSIGWVMK
jgi:protein SCO1